MRKFSIILYGPPGSGKGTQAELLAREFGLVHFDTGRFLESMVHDPARQREKIIRRERRLFDEGYLMTPSFVRKEVLRQIERLYQGGLGVVLSGSPRTLYEADSVISLLEKLYGKKNIFVIRFIISDEEVMRRNTARLLCRICKAPLLTKYYPSKTPKYCPVCAGPLYRRTLDKPEAMRLRLTQYRDRTEPVIKVWRKRGYRIHEVDGRLAPYKIFKEVMKRLPSRSERSGKSQTK